jgi:predicted phage terminase large subunit-like protein
LTVPTASELDRELAKRSLAEFIRQAWPIVEPATPYSHNWHIDLICEHLEAVTAGDITRLVVNIPPRNTKSLCVTVMWPCWEWIRRPELRYLCCSYAASLSTKHSVDRRRIIESEWYQANWPHVHLTSDQNQKTEYENTSRGVMVATSVGGTATGKGGNRVIVDDPVNPEEAYSEVKRVAAHDYMDKTLPSRLDDKRRDAMIVVMQRLHADDSTGHLLSRDATHRWTHVCIPAECRERTEVVFPRSGRVIVREPGDLLWPEREGAGELAALREEMGTRDFEAQYNQEPAPPEGAMFNPSWWRYYREVPEPLDEIIQSWDMTFKDRKQSDYVVGQVWGRKGASKYLLDQVRARMDFPATQRAVVSLSAKWPQAHLKLIEDTANGPAVIASLKESVAGIVPVKVKGSKAARAAAITPTVEAGNVYLPDVEQFPQHASWVGDFVHEHAVFTGDGSGHDDQVDACSQALSRWIKAKQVYTGRGF